MAGVERIPIRWPDRWDPAFMDRLMREVFALADTRNAIAGPGIAITSTPEVPATISGSADIQALLDASLVTAQSEALSNTRRLIGDPRAIEIQDNGPGKTIQVLLAWGIPIERLGGMPGLAVLGAPAEDDDQSVSAIESTADHQLLRRVPETDPTVDDDSRLDWGQLTVPMAPDNLWPYAKLQQGSALSVLGVAGGAQANLADIAAGGDDTVLRRVSGGLGFGQLTLAMAPDSLWTHAKIQDSAALTVLGRAAATGGVLADIAAGANDRLLSRVGDALAFTQLTAGMFPNAVVPDAALSANVALYNGDVAQFSVGVFANARISQASVTQHQAALSIGWGQLTGVPSLFPTNAANVAFAASSRFLGRITAGAGAGEELTGAEATTLLGVFTDLLQGVVPASGGGTTNFLRADGAWAAPPGGGGSVAWGAITGTLSDQTDLQTALNATVKLTGAQTVAGAKNFTAALQAASIELGHASDTTLARIAAGRVSIEGGEIAKLNGTQPFSTKQQFQATPSAPNTTAAEMRHADGNDYDVGMNVMPELVHSTNLTFAREHVGKFIIQAGSTARTWTIPASADTSIPNGATINIANHSTGVVTIAPGSGVSLFRYDGTGATATGSRTLSQGGVATLYKSIATQWRIWGNAGLN